MLTSARCFQRVGWASASTIGRQADVDTSAYTVWEHHHNMSIKDKYFYIMKVYFTKVTNHMLPAERVVTFCMWSSSFLRLTPVR